MFPTYSHMKMQEIFDLLDHFSVKESSFTAFGQICFQWQVENCNMLALLSDTACSDSGNNNVGERQPALLRVSYKVMV